MKLTYHQMRMKAFLESLSGKVELDGWHTTIYIETHGATAVFQHYKPAVEYIKKNPGLYMTLTCVVHHSKRIEKMKERS